MGRWQAILSHETRECGPRVVGGETASSTCRGNVDAGARQARLNADGVRWSGDRHTTLSIAHGRADEVDDAVDYERIGVVEHDDVLRRILQRAAARRR